MGSISKETLVCLSIAQRPSSFGVTVHNAAFKHEGIDAVYLARELDPQKNSIKQAILSLRVLGIRGCGVSMPFKIEAMNYVDSLDSSAQEVGALNTIVNENGKLVGYNTDYYGAVKALSLINKITDKSVVLLGTGGVALAISAAIRHLNIKNVTVAGRSIVKAHALGSQFGFDVSPWQQRSGKEADIIINATSIGMKPNENELPIETEDFEKFKIFYDVVISPVKTKFVNRALSQEKMTISGEVMCLYQAAMQFELYTGKPAPTKIMIEAMRQLLGS